MNIIHLRGGGCGASKKGHLKHQQEQERGKQKVDMTEKEKMAKLIQLHSEIISKNAIIAMSERKKLMSSFQFFLDNSQELWGIIIDKEESNQIIDIIKVNLKPLLEALRILIKGFVAYSVYLSQIISLLSWIVFCYYSNSKLVKDRFMKDDQQASFLEIIKQIKTEIDIEKNIDKYQNNLEYELYIIESIFTIVPTDKDEAQEIATSFLIGAATSFLSFSINDQFLNSLKQGVIYIYNEHDKASRKKILKIIFALLQLKYEIVTKIQKSDQLQDFALLDRLNQVYKDIVCKSSDWQVWCTWIKVLSQLFQQKLILPLDKIQSLKISDQHYIHKNLSRKTCWLNIDSTLIERDATAKLIYQNIEELQELGRLQYSILYGYQQMPSFELLYSSKLTQSMEKENFDAFQFSLSSISIMLHNAQEIKKAQESLQQHIELLSTTNKSKIQDIENYLTKAIDNTIQLLEYIYSLHEVENPNDNELESPKQVVQQSAIFQSQNIQNQSAAKPNEQKKEKWLDEIVKLKKSLSKKFVAFFLKSLLLKINDDETKEEYQKDFILNESKKDEIIQSSQQSYQLNVLDIFEEIEQRKVEKKKVKTPNYFDIVNNYKKEPFQIETLQLLQSRLKYIRIKPNKHGMKIIEQHKFGFQEAIKLIQEGSAFLRWNLRLLVKMKFYIQELSQNQYNDKQTNQQTFQIINSLKVFSQQLASIKAIQKCIKFFYSKYDACVKYKLIRKVSQKRNVIYQILKTITIKKFETLNMVYQINKETIRKVKDTGVIYICSSIFQAIQNEHQKFLDDIVQLKRAIQMIIDILNADEKKNKKDQDEFQVFLKNDIFKYYKIEYPKDHAQWLKNKDSLFQIQLFYQNYCLSYQNWQKKNKNFSQEVSKQIEMKQQSIKEYIEKIELAQGYKTIQEEDDEFKQELYNAVTLHLKPLLDLLIYSEQDNEIAETNFPQENKTFFNSLFNFINEIEHQVQIQFDNLKFINQQQGLFQTLINNSLLLKKAQSQYQNKIEQNEKKIKELVAKYEEKLPEQVFNLDVLYEEFDKSRLKFSPNLKSEIFFILTQIWKQEDVTSDPGYYDQFKEAASDLINQNKWRVRQSCIFELLQFKNSCLAQATVDLTRGLLVKCTIYETDRRNKQLLDDQDQNQVVSMIQQCWTQQEDDVQSKIKQKLEELNDIAYKITIETKQYEKSKYKKRYVELESEIQGIVKNAESLGNSLGTSLLFFQDIKSDLVNIQSQLKNLQGSIDQIHRDIQLLQGRSIKDLLIIRMQRVLQQRIIFNSENVYVPIKTKEKQMLENSEDEETPLYTDDLFSNGEINEFIWKQQKLSLLIHGQAGSGKSTAARKIEEFLWLLFKKNMNIAESIPIIPIFVSLPQLKDPISMAMEETLKSDNYRFNDKQIIEFREAIEQNQFKLVIIMDSYDEIKSEFTNRNLILSNKLYRWRCQSDEFRFPKIITTSRSEMFINNEYRSWFLPESENIQFYKEIRLLNFNNEQVNTYIEYHTIFCVKKIIKDFFFNNKDNSGFFAFEELFNEIIKIINDKEQQDDQADQQFLLIKNQIERILSLCGSFVSGDIALTMQQQLEEVWCKDYYIKNIKQMDIGSLLETPFMIEIVASVLPQMIKHRQELNTLKESFQKKIQQQEKVSVEQLSKEWSKIINNEQFLDKYLKTSNDTERDILISQHFDKLENFKIIQNALKLDPLCSYDFYDQFFAQYFKRQITKLKDSGESLVYISNLSDLWEFTHRLANDMTLFQLSQVQYIPRILLFQKKKDVDWRDVYFNDEQEQGQIKKLFRKIMPIRQKYGIYSFNHKSLQEFLVAKWLIQQLDQFNSNISQELEGFDNQLDDLCVHNLSKDFMSGVVRFMVDKLSQNQYLQVKLFEIVKISKFNQKNDSIKVSDNLKVSQSIKLKRAQTQLLASQKVTQNLYSDEEKMQRIIQASSNSLYLLHLLKYPFNEDLSQIQINDIELLNGNFFEADLTHSKFSKVNISQSNFNFAKLESVIWKDIVMDELPRIVTKEKPLNEFFYFICIKSEDLLIFKTKSRVACYNYKYQSNVESQKLNEYFNPIPKYILESPKQTKIALFFDDSITIILTSGIKSKITFPFTFQIAYFTNKEELIIGSNEYLIKLKIEDYEQNIQINPNDKINLTNYFKFKKMIQIVNTDNDIIFIADKELIFLKEINLNKEQNYNEEQKLKENDKIFVYFKFLIQFVNQELYDENRQEEEGLSKYTCIQVSENQNLLLIGYQLNNDSSGIQVIEKQNLIEKSQDHDENKEFKQQKKYITSTKSTQLDIIGEENLKAYFVDDDKYILSFSLKENDTYMRLWNYKEKKIISCTLLDGKITAMTKIANLLIATINQEGVIQIWDLCALLQQQNSNTKSTITCCIFSINSNIISGSQEGIIQVWDRQRGTKIGKDLQNHTSSVSSLVVTQQNNEEILISGDSKGIINIWSLLKFQLRRSISIVSPIKSLNILVINQNEYQLLTLSQYYHYIQLWAPEYQSYKLFCENIGNNNIDQKELQQTILELKNKTIKVSPKKYSNFINPHDCSAFAIGKYTNYFYFAESPNLQQNQTKNEFIKIYKEEFLEFQESKIKDHTQEQLTPYGTVYRTENMTEIVSIIKEFNKSKILVATQTKIFKINIQKQSIENQFDYANKIDKILDIQIDEDLLFCCGNNVVIKNIRSGKDIPSAIKTSNENQNEIQMVGQQQQDYFCCLTFYRKQNKLFIGTTSGKIIEYDLLYCTSVTHYQHNKQIIYLQIHTRQQQNGIQDILVSAAKDSFLYFWPLTIQDLKQLKPTESKQIQFNNQDINQLWYFDQENYFICQNESGYYLVSTNNDLSYYQICDYDPSNKCDYNNQKQAFYQLYLNKLTKTMVLQEAIKAHHQENNQYKAQIVFICPNKQIITSDDDANILFWNHDGHPKCIGEYNPHGVNAYDKIQPFKNAKPEQVQISLSNKYNSLVCGCFDFTDKCKKYLIAIISLEDRSQKDREIKQIFLNDEPKLKQLQLLSENYILILTDSKIHNISIYSINESKIKQNILDRSGQSIGSAILTLEDGKNQKSVFLTYGQFNQLTYYDQIGDDQYASRFSFGDSIKKFSCKYAKIDQSIFLSIHGIDLKQIFKQGIEN